MWKYEINVTINLFLNIIREKNSDQQDNKYFRNITTIVLVCFNTKEILDNITSTPIHYVNHTLLYALFVRKIKFT